MRKVILLLAVSSFHLGCSQSPSPQASASAREPAPSAAPSSTAAPGAATTSSPALPVACSAAGLAAAKDACLSAACGEIPAEMTRCQNDADCKMSSFALCECVNPGPFFSVNASSYATAREKLQSKYASECNCACHSLAPACVDGACGFKRQ